MFYIIYQITNLINSKIYIGKHQTNNLDDGYFGSGKYLRNSIIKHGSDNFRKDILFQFDSEAEMNAKEKELVNEEFLKRPDVYNICPGGKDGFGYINANLTADDKKISSARNVHETKYKTDENYRQNFKMVHKARMADPKIRAKISENMKGVKTFEGKNHSEKTKIQMSKSHQGKHDGPKNSQYGKCWINNGQENKMVKKEEFDLWAQLGYNKGLNMKLFRK